MVVLRARSWMVLAVVVLVAALLSAGAPAAGAPPSAETGAEAVTQAASLAEQATSVVEVTVADRDELDDLVATGTDLDHSVEQTDAGLVVHAVVTAEEAAGLSEAGFDVGDVVYSPEEAEQRIAEREATIAGHRQANTDFAAATSAPAVGDVKVIRADYYTSGSNQILSVEAKWAQGQTDNDQLVVERDSGPGTEIGSGGTQNISRFVDAGVYLYHRGAALVTSQPEYVRVTSPTGDSHVVEVEEWLPFDEDDPEPPGYQKDFITSYLTPTELYDRIHQLAEEFPDLATIVELPHKTNGYRRKAQALLDPPAPRIVIDGPSSAAGEYEAAPASFGPSAPSAGIAGAVALGDDGTGDVNDGCESLVGFPAGAIALVDRGNCNYTVKTLNAQAAGAVALVIANNTGGIPSPGGNAPGITIPTVQISQDAGVAIKAGLPATGRFFSESVSSNRRVGIDSVAWGHEGGNDVSVEVVDPGAPDQALTVSAVGPMIRVDLATDAGGATTSTAADVVAALNAHPGASARVMAYTYRGSSGDGLVAATAGPVQLSDFLDAPDSVSREPHPVYALRIGERQEREKKTGVLAYAQEHAREWVPPLVTIETAERLLRNHRTDGQTRRLLRELDIWIAPSINPDGGHYSFYDDNGQRRNMTRHCDVTGAFDLNARDNWGVDNNRNYDEYSLFDGYSGASTSCTSDVYAGPSELSEPENRNVDWLASRGNIKFSMNLHSSGNYFMWSPGSYAMPGRVSAPRPTLAEESFFWGASSQILTAIKRHRNLAVTPARTGPISDVLYSAAGNSGDMLWYKHGIYAWNFEVGTSFQPNWEEAHAETMEFANGLVELLHVAYDYDKDRRAPRSSVATYASTTPGMVDVMFETTEPAAVFYSTDGSAPTLSSTMYASAGIREAGEVLTVPEGTTFHWFSVDSAGNAERGYDPSRGSRAYNRTTVP